jgi:dTDP-4-dehydrorhamnose 3,5-epimerase
MNTNSTDAPRKDAQSTTTDGRPLEKLPWGVSFHEVTTHIDDRGSLVELYDPRWGWHDAPMVYSYCFTLRPGAIKGWAMHKKHEDRYFILIGELELVLYDDREGSPTRGMVSKIYLSELNRRLINIPAGIWHANRNIGGKDVVAVNFPTQPYDRSDPDKYRLPPNNDTIPHVFDSGKGW